MSDPINLKLTTVGSAAVWNAHNNGLDLQLTHIQVGSGNRIPDGTEEALIAPSQASAIGSGVSISDTQIRMSALFGGSSTFTVREIGVWAGNPSDAGSILVFYWSQATGELLTKPANVDFVFAHDMTLGEAVPSGSLTILVDGGQSAMLSMINNHQIDASAHPQYALLAGANFTGDVTGLTPSPGDNSGKFATTRWMNENIREPGLIVWGLGSTIPARTLRANGAAVSRETYADLFDKLVTSAGFTEKAFTVTIGNAAVFNRVNHGLGKNSRLRLSTDGALPTGLNSTSDYYVLPINNDNFNLANAPNGPAINLSGTQSGAHSYLQSYWGLGDGSSTFNVPDLRGYHLRGLDDGRGVDIDRVLGSLQSQSIQAHTHSLPHVGTFLNYASGVISFGAVMNSPGGATNSTGGTETVPYNIAIPLFVTY